MNSRLSPRRLAALALLVSLYIVLSRILSLRIPMGSIEGVRIGFGPLAPIFAGMAFGSASGFAVGAIGDLLGYMINPMGPYIPVFTLTAGIRGMLPALVWDLTGRKLSFAGTLLPMAVSGLVSATAVPLCIWAFFHVSPAVTMPPAFIAQCFTIPLYAFLFVRLYNCFLRRSPNLLK